MILKNKAFPGMAYAMPVFYAWDYRKGCESGAERSVRLNLIHHTDWMGDIYENHENKTIACRCSAHAHMDGLTWGMTYENVLKGWIRRFL